MQTTSDGWVWVSRREGLFRYHAGKEILALRENAQDILADGKTLTVAGAHLWTGNTAGFREFPVKPNGPLTGDREHGVWFGCGTAVCQLRSDGNLVRHELDDPEKRWWVGAAREDSGNIWAWTSKITARFASSGHPEIYGWPMLGPPPASQSVSAYRGANGTIQLSEYGFIHNGLFWIERPPLAGGPDGARQGEDAFGNMWQANIDAPLTLLAPKTWIRGWGLSQFPNGCNSISRSGERLLAACASGVYAFPGFRKRGDDEWTLLPGSENGGPVWAASGVADGGIWGIFASKGIIRLDRKGEETQAAWRSSAKGLDFRSFFRDSQNRLWVGAKGGLFRVDEEGGRLQKEPLPDGHTYATAFASGPDGRQWLGFDGGIANYHNKRWETILPASLLLSSRVRSIAVGPGPVFWVAYRDTLPFSRIERSADGWIRHDFTAADGYQPGETRSLLRDSRGWIWRSTPHGLFVSDGIHLDRHDWLEFRAFHNLPAESTGPFALFEDRDRSIWVATEGGVAQVRPDASWFTAAKGPPPRVTAIRWHGRERFWPESGIRLENAGGDLQIDFAQWPEASPLPQAIRYRLLPLQTEWRWGDAGVAEYPDLKPGKYQFELSSRGAAVTTFSFQVPVTTLWVWPLTVSMIVTAAGSWFTWRVRRGSALKAEYWKEKEAYLNVYSGGVEPEVHAGEMVSERYRIEEQIGEGGFASVWRARDVVTGSAVAVKFLNVQDEIESWQISRFEKETEALRRIDHPGVVKLLESGRNSAGAFWLAMAWIDGPSLRAVLRSGPIGKEKAAAWIRQIGAAVAEAHARGVLHRDLKPENVLIERGEKHDERVVVVDFGAAAIEYSPGRQSSMHLGSFDYMAPERVLGQSSPATDVYGLAALAFEMLTGVRFAGVTASSAEGMTRLLAGFSHAVARELAGGLSYSPEDRPADILAFAVKLADALSA